MSIRAIALVAGACLFSCASQRSAVTSPSQTPETLLLQLALDVVHGGMSREQYASITHAIEDAMIETMEKQAAADHKTLPPAFRQFIAEISGRYLSYEAACESMAEVYARSFTEADLRRIAAYQATETFRKQMKLVPEMMQKEARRIQQVLADHGDEIRTTADRMMHRVPKADAKP